METLALRDGDILPTQEVLETALGSSYPAFEELNALLIAMEIRPEWNYYRDGKAWLCKNFYEMKPVGKLLPMSIVVGDKEKLEDVLTVLRFKRSLK